MNLMNPCINSSHRGWTSLTCDANGIIMISLSLAASLLALGMVVFLMKRLHNYPRGNDKMNKISDLIQDGAKSFLRTEYKYLFLFCFGTSIIITLLYCIDPPSGNMSDGIRIGICFIAGASLSAAAGWAGMIVATDANVRTTQSAMDHNLSTALRVAFTGGSVMGFTVAGLALFGLVILLFLMTLGQQQRYNTTNDTDNDTDDINNNLLLTYAIDSLVGFGFGSSTVALIARVSGGIYTKAADVGADLCGKIELNIPEDDPRNPATIADNVGDNVGDVAGMGADLFEGLVGSVLAAMTLAEGRLVLIVLPLGVVGVGIMSCVAGYFAVGVGTEATEKDDGGRVVVRQKDLLLALHKGTITASVLLLFFCAILCHQLFNHGQNDEDTAAEGLKVFLCITIGLLSGISIGHATEYFTSYSYHPVQSITDAGLTGPATVIIQGLGMGMLSCVPTVLIITITILSCHALNGDYGIAIAAVGMLSTLAINLATDAYGPIADNAGGIAEMAGLDDYVRETTDALDAVGNTTAATGKGFAIGSAVLTALSLLSAFKDQTGLAAVDGGGGGVDVSDPVVLSGMLLGAMLPFLFAALTMLSVRKAAGAIINEVRRQFTEIDGLREGLVDADSDKCIAISTQSSIEETMLPGLYAIFSPLVMGFLIGPKALAGMLAGSIASGMMLAVMMANAGGAWDNAKKYIENEGAMGGKGTETHKACVVGDTVGDPFKDTSGPALNILIKLMCMVALTIAPLIKEWEDWQHWQYGLIPMGLLIVGNCAIYRYLRQEHRNSSNEADDDDDDNDSGDSFVPVPDDDQHDLKLSTNGVIETKKKAAGGVTPPRRTFLKMTRRTNVDLKSKSLLPDEKDPQGPGKLV